MSVTVRELAKELEADPQTTRKFLRSVIRKHPKGNRWEIDENDIPRIKLLYEVKRVGINHAVETLRKAQ